MDEALKRLLPYIRSENAWYRWKDRSINDRPALCSEAGIVDMDGCTEQGCWGLSDVQNGRFVWPDKSNAEESFALE